MSNIHKRIIVKLPYNGKWEGVNCYTKPMPGYKNYYSWEAKTIQVAQMKKSSFVDKLNVQTLTVLPAWTTDKDNINATLMKRLMLLVVRILLLRELPIQIIQLLLKPIIVNEIGELENPFSDVPNDKWYYPYVLKAYNRGLVSGVSTDKTIGLVQFAPEAKITREQFVQILYSLEGKPKVEYKALFKGVPEQSDTVWYSNAIM